MILIFTVHFMGIQRLESATSFVTLGWLRISVSKFKRTENHNFTITTNTSQHVEFFHSLIFESFLVIVDSAHWSFVIIITQINISRYVLLGKLNKTRIHSSRMRTGRLLTVCWSLLPGGSGLGGSGPGGMSGLGGLVCGGLVWGRSGPEGVRGVWSGRVSGPGCLPWGVWFGGYIPAWSEADLPCGQTHACENITLAQLLCGW